ncbi:MAG: riboflavin synthase [Azospirillum sp.]|nr:riboflavin synthase [Azospirillum sp.]
MFTGIVTDLGEVVAREEAGDSRFVIATRFDPDTIALGASIACSGVCLTVIEAVSAAASAGGAGRFAVQVSAETLSKTTLGDWHPGTRVNLERSLRLGDELGGHLVSGHVDGVATVIDIRPEGDSKRFTIEAPAAFERYIAPKGSVALDGVSLTVNEVAEDEAGRCRFGINIIPHTQSCTTFGLMTPGARMNFEVDLLARYVARQIGRP